MNRLTRAAVGVVMLLLAFQFVPSSIAAASQTPGAAAAVALTIVPPKLPADGQSYPAAIVSLIDANGLPTAAFGNLTVFLTSSQVNIAAVPNSVTIYSGHEYAIANLTTTTTPGSAMITAHSEGLTAPPPSLVTTVTPSGFPSKLVVFTSPSVFLPRTDHGVLRVEVVDDAGLPSKAINSIPVSLSSSNQSIASIDQTILTIPSGSIIVDGTFHTSNPGSAVFTATSTGYSTGTALVTVNTPSICIGACSPYKLALRTVPGTLPTDGLGYSVLEVSLQTQSGAPAVSSSDTVVQLTSDKSEVASVPGLITVPAGSISSLATVTTSALAGVANVTAASAGLLPATIPIRTVIPAPSKLQAYIAPPASAYSTIGNYPILVVQLQDSSGNPARARQATSIVVTSSNGSLLSSYVTLSIPQGNDYVFSYLHTKGVGTSVLTASSQGLSSSQAALTSVPDPLNIHLALVSTTSGFIFENQTATFSFTASFVGQPIQNMNVTWTTTKGAMSPVRSNTGTTGSTSSVLTPASFGAYTVTIAGFSKESGPVLLRYNLTVAQVPQKPAPSLVQQIVGYWYYIVAAVAVVVIAAVYLLRMRRKKQRAEIEAGFEVV